MNAIKLANGVEAAKPKHLIELQADETPRRCFFHATFTRQRTITWAWPCDVVADLVRQPDAAERLARALTIQAANMLPVKKKKTTTADAA